MYHLLGILPDFRAQQSIPDPNPIPQPTHSTLASSQSPSSPLPDSSWNLFPSKFTKINSVSNNLYHCACIYAWFLITLGQFISVFSTLLFSYVKRKCSDL